jgi:hypothetical protein
MISGCSACGRCSGRGFESYRHAQFLKNRMLPIGENYWQKRFGGDRAVVGRTICLNGVSLTIARITPHDFCGTAIGAPACAPIAIRIPTSRDVEWQALVALMLLAIGLIASYPPARRATGVDPLVAPRHPGTRAGRPFLHKMAREG